MKKEKVFTEFIICNILEDLKMKRYSEKSLKVLFEYMQEVFQRNFDDIVYFPFHNFSIENFIKHNPEYENILQEKDSVWMNIYNLRNRKMDLDFFAKVSMDENCKTVISFFENIENNLKKGRASFGVVKDNKK